LKTVFGIYLSKILSLQSNRLMIVVPFFIGMTNIYSKLWLVQIVPLAPKTARQEDVKIMGLAAPIAAIN
jgi:hypothetical protein